MTIDEIAPSETPVVRGTVAPGFDAVRDAFEANFAERGERGAACAVYVDGIKVVDLWGGLADHTTGRPWTENTLSVIWSATKGAVGVLLNLLAQRGRIDLDRPVADYWPEFAQNGKGRITVRMVLDHQAGLPAIDEPLTMDQMLAVTPVNDRLARQAPTWEPGTDHGYHAFTYGFLLSEIVARVTGRSLGRVFAEEVAAPLGLDFWIGLPAEHEHRVARLIDVTMGDTTVLDGLPEPLRGPGEALFGALADPTSLSHRALHPSGVGFANADFNDPRTHRAEWAFGGGICDARSLARLYAACVGEVDGVRLLSEQTLAEATAEQGSRPDRVLWYPTRWGTGFMLPNQLESWLGPGSFAFTGAGGHLGLGNTEMRVGLAYTMTRMGANLTGDPRPAAVVDALRSCLR
jgi:CubicO group peptidase (beta-lactamase class C family)